MTDLDLRHVRKVYPGGVVGVDDVSLRVDHGSFLVLLGPSGCGKSTLLQIIAGLEPLTAGEVNFGGTRVDHLPANKRNVAMVFQSYALYPNMTVYRNIAFGLKMRKVSAEEIDRSVRRVAESLGLSEVLQRRPGQLSGGQRQRVALGRAIVRDPAVFLLDEPLSNVDAKLRNDMRVELKALHKRLNGTFIYVTHDQEEAMSLGDYVAVMDRGSLRQFGTPMEIYNRPSDLFVAGFVGSPAMNQVKGSLRVSGGVHLVAQGLECSWAAGELGPAVRDGMEVIVGFRPPDVKVALSPVPGTDAQFTAPVEFLEPLGSDLLLTLATVTGRMVVRVDPDFTVRPGEVVNVGINKRRLHVFDADSGIRIDGSSAPADLDHASESHVGEFQAKGA